MTQEAFHKLVHLVMASPAKPPEKLFLGDFKYKSTKASKWGIHQKVQPKLAYTKNEKVVMEPLTKELLSSL